MRSNAILYAGLGVATILALPACSFHITGLPPNNFDPGQTPQSHVVFCDIEVTGNGPDGTARQCADSLPPSQVQLAIPLTNAALALNSGQMSGMTGLDKSSGAVQRCGSNGEVVFFRGPFPQGVTECLNCGSQIPNKYADANAVCQAACADYASPLQNPPAPDVVTFCQNHAHVSTNVPLSGCPAGFDNACTDAGSLSMSFVDPRIQPEPVVWTQLTGVTAGGANGNDLTMTAATVPNQFTAQAVSLQTVTGGDAYVEFSAAENTLAHVIGFAVNPPPNDADPTPNDIDFALRLGTQGLVFVSNLGNLVNGPGLNGSLQTYQPGDRFRITLTDLNNDSFTVQYAKVIGACTPGTACNLQTFYVDVIKGGYPVRLDTSFRDQGATLTNVTLVRIQPPQ